MFEKKHLHICIATDDNYASLAATAILSVIKNNRSFDKVSIHLLCNHVDGKTLKCFEELIKGSEQYVYLYTYDISDIRSRLTIDVPPTISITAYTRLFVSEVLSEEIERIIYIDCDTICNDSLQALWEMPLDDLFIAGVLDTLPDCESKRSVGLRDDMPYLNSGVLLINLKEWRNHNLTSKFLQYLVDKNGFVHHHDQGIINAICKSHLKVIAPCYNVTSPYYSHPYALLHETNNPFYSEEEVIAAKLNPVIIHFTEGFLNRPWCDNCRHPLKRFYFDYAAVCTSFGFDYTLKKDTRKLHVRVLSRIFLDFPYPVYRIVSQIIGFAGGLKKKL